MSALPFRERPGDEVRERDEEWTRVTIDGVDPRVEALLVRSPTEAGVSHVLPDRPLVAIDEDGPALSLTLLLSRPPTTSDESINDLIQGGTLSLDASLAVDEAALEALTCLENMTADEYEPLFVQSATFELVATATPNNGTASPANTDVTGSGNASDTDEPIDGEPGRAIATATATGSNPRVALTASLGATDSIDVFRAIRGTDSTIRLRATIRYRPASTRTEIGLTGSWAAVHDALSTTLDPGESVGRDELRRHFGTLVDDGTLRVTVDGTPADLENESALDAAFRAFMRQAVVVLRRTVDDRYVLGSRPHPMFELNATETSTGADEATVSLESSLAETIGSIPSGDVERYVSLTAPGIGDDGGYREVPRRVAASSRGVDRDDGSRGGETGSPRLMASTVGLHAVTHAINPGSAAAVSIERPGPQLTAPEIAVVRRPDRLTVLEDVIVADDTRSRPLVEKDREAAAAWRDRANRSLGWYAPSFEVIRPDPAADPEGAPFGFEYVTTGVTVEGEQSLEATVHLTLRETKSPEARAELDRFGVASARPVEARNIAVTLDVPFVEGGTTRAHSFVADVERVESDLRATFRLRDAWVWLCYGALAYPDFQQQPVVVRVAYTFEAFVPAPERTELVVGRPSAMTPVVFSPEARPKTPAYFDASTATLYRHGDALTFGIADVSREAMDTDEGGRGGGGAELTPTALSAVRPTLIHRPVLTAATVATTGVTAPTYAVRHLPKRTEVAVSVPCDEYGAFYRQRTAAGVEAVGCRDPPRLGEIRYRLYDELPALRTDDYRVYRSLTQPGRFLVVPTAYRIARHDPTSETAYRPCAVVYSVLDTVNPSRNRVVFEASLHPDVAPFQRRDLLDRLGAYAADPVLEFPTEVMSDASVDWTVEAFLEEPVVVDGDDLFRVTVATDLTNGLLLQSMLANRGVVGRARLALPDGSTLETDLELRLDATTGPWNGGPIETTDLGDGSVRLTNRLEGDVSVAELRVYEADARVATVPVERVFGAGESQTVALPADVRDDDVECYPVFERRPMSAATFEEVNLFIEDLTTNVIFLVQFNYGRHDLETVEIDARIRGTETARRVPLAGSPPTGALEFTLPLLTYLDPQVLQFRVTTVGTDGTRASTPWLDWSLSEEGNVVGLTWEMVAMEDG